jgi:hypothetical protein
LSPDWDGSGLLNQAAAAAGGKGEREFFIETLLVRIHIIIWMVLVDRACAMGVLNSVFHVA